MTTLPLSNAGETVRAPLPLGVLAVHVAAVVLIQSTALAVQFMMAFLARKHFHANDWETLIITAAPTVLVILSIFWQRLSQRVRPARYLLLYWLVAFAPMLMAAWISNFWQLATLHVIAAVGGAAWAPIAGGFLKRFYADERRGLAYGISQFCYISFGAVAGFGLGQVLGHDPENFRTIFPIAAGLQLTGILLLIALDRAMHHSRQPLAPPSGDQKAGIFAAAIEPLLHARSILKADRVFFRYEAAFMTYGVGWMICTALLPIMATDRLHLDYEQYPLYTQVPLYAGMALMAFPFGWLNDRLGPARTSAVAFALYTFMPLGLIVSGAPADLIATCSLWGVCSAGVNVGWMLGPVTLAPSPAQVPQYVAIHATMVGLRGTLFQFIGLLLYKATGSFTASLLIGAAGFAWAAVQMWGLRGQLGRTRTPDAPAGR